jgi:glycosyltransferase involved in cell wall biosynthesis
VSRRERIPIERTHIIPNGVDHQRFRVANREAIRARIRAELNLHPSLPLVLSVGSLRPIKGHDVLIEAVRTVRETEPDLQFQALVVGAGPLRGEYEQSARGLPISFAGFHKDVERFYLAADVYCQPSRSEALPNAVLEAMCCGLPVVASDVGSVADLVTADNGLLCVPGDPGSLARQLHRMLAHPEVWPSLGLGSRTLSEGFSAETMVDSYVSLYASLMSGARRHA